MQRQLPIRRSKIPSGSIDRHGLFPQFTSRQAKPAGDKSSGIYFFRAQELKRSRGLNAPAGVIISLMRTAR